MEVGAYHKVDAGLVEKGHEMNVQPALQQVVVFVRMVNHGYVQQADLDGSLAEGLFLYGLFGPGKLLCQIVLVYLAAAVKY